MQQCALWLQFTLVLTEIFLIAFCLLVRVQTPYQIFSSQSHPNTINICDTASWHGLQKDPLLLTTFYHWSLMLKKCSLILTRMKKLRELNLNLPRSHQMQMLQKSLIGLNATFATNHTLATMTSNGTF